MQLEDFQDQIAQILIDIESVKFSFDKPFILTSGNKSPVYVDCRKIISYVNERNFIIDKAIKYIEEKKLEFDLLAGGETAGIPYASFLAEKLNKKMIYVRKKAKDFGKNQQIEGDCSAGEKVILIEDLATDGGSKVVFVNALRNIGLKISDIFVIFYYDIFDIKETALGSLDINIHFLCSWKNIINVLSNNNIYGKEKIDNLNFFLNDPNGWRNKNA